MSCIEKPLPWIALFSFCCLLLAGCNASAHRAAHELISLRTEENIWGHKVTVTPCAHSDRKTHSDGGPENSKHVIKCRNAEVIIENEVLSVNGKSYGKLAEKATVRVEDQKVFINDVETQPVVQTSAAPPPASTRTVKQKLAKTWRALFAKTEGTAHQLASR